MGLINYLEKTDGTQEMVKNFLDLAEKNNIIAFGAGVGGKALYSLLKENNLGKKLLAWADNNPLKWDKTYLNPNLLIYNPNVLQSKIGNNYKIVVSSSAYPEIKNQLIKLGFKHEDIILFNFAFMDLVNTDYKFVQEHIDDFERAFLKMKDEKSKRIFINLLNYKITKKTTYLNIMHADVDEEKYQYFDKSLFNLNENEILLDIGAYTGDTFINFNQIYQSRWDKYIGIEADKAIYNNLKETTIIAKNKVILFNCAAWDKNTTLFLSDNPGSGQTRESGNEFQEKIIAKKIDDLYIDKVTLIKLDIEGAEKNAIKGMVNLIQHNLPIIAVCVYHQRDDYYAITDLIESIVPNEYSYYMRQYRYTPTETVCYAIPKKRAM